MGRKETHIIFEEKFCYFGYMPSVTICVKKKKGTQWRARPRGEHATKGLI